MIRKLLLLLIALPILCTGQTEVKEYHGDVNYRNVTEIKGLIYIKADTSLVTGKVIRYTKKNVAKSYILVKSGKPDELGWIQISDDFVRPKESVLGEVVAGTAFITGAVMAVTGNDLNMPIQKPGDRENELEDFLTGQNNDTNKAYNEMSERNDITQDLESGNNRPVIEKPSDGRHQNQYENGQLKSVENYAAGKKNGLWETYYSNGKLETKGNYKENKKNGIWKEYFENGQLKSKSNYVLGKKEDLFELYHSNGQLKGKINYKNGKEDGIFEGFHENGQLMLTGLIKGGIQIGEWNYYNEQGVLTKTENYEVKN